MCKYLQEMIQVLKMTSRDGGSFSNEFQMMVQGSANDLQSWFRDRQKTSSDGSGISKRLPAMVQGFVNDFQRWFRVLQMALVEVSKIDS